MSVIQNPLISGNKLLLPSTPSYIEINKSNLSTYFKNVYILVKKNDNRLPINFFMKTIDEKIYNNNANDLVIWKTSLEILSYKNIFDKLCILSKDQIQIFNEFNFELNDYNLVVSIFNISFKNIINFLTINDSNSNFDKLYNYLVISEYLGPKNDDTIVIQDLIKSIDGSNKWISFSHKPFTLDKFFKNKKFKNSKNNTKKDENNKIVKSNNNEDYLQKISKYKTYLPNISNIVYKSDYKLDEDMKYSREDINNLFLKLDGYNRYLLFCHLLISKSHCHLAINNEYILDLMKHVIKKYAPVFRYLMGYSWLTLYLDGIVKKSNLNITDRTVFDINTASKLPLFPFSKKYLKFSPYMPVLVDDKLLNSEYNINGLCDYRFNKNYIKGAGICNLEEFQNNMNIFITGNKTKNLFTDINWEKNKIAIGGSIIAACLQKHHPLMNMFNTNNIDDRKKRYYNEYYANADVDVMFLTNDVFEYIDNVNDFYNQIVVNTCNVFSPYAEPNHIKLKTKFQANITIQESWVSQNIANENLTFDFIYKNINEPSIKNLFKPFFESKLTEKINEEFKDKTSDELLDIKNKYPHYFINGEDYELNIYIYPNKKNINIQEKSVDKLDDLDKSVDDLETDSHTDIKEKSDFEIKINYKYHITSPHFNHQLELFMAKGENHISFVSKFHKDCVRGYYCGNNVYMTDECVRSHHTYVNLTSKYVAGSTNEFEIYNKYFMRGWIELLNESQILSIYDYAKNNEFWKNLFGINPEQPPTSIRGYITYKHKIFHPRLVNVDYYYDAPLVNLEEGYQDEHKGDYYNTLDQLNIDTYASNDLTCTNRQLPMERFHVINSTGNITPVQKWVIQAYYEMIDL